MESKYKLGQEIMVKIDKFTPLGIVVTFDQNKGLVFSGDTFENYEVGQEVIGYIKNIRDDGKIDITFRKQGYKNFISSTSSIILSALQKEGGFLPFNDKSEPDEIKRKFGISKNQFKQAIGKLFKERKLKITKIGIELIQ